MIGTNNKKNKRAYSLIEVIVSVAIFTFIIVSSTEIFRLVIRGQRQAVASQNVQESLKYFFEVTAKEIRMARRSTGSCNVPAGDIFHLESGSYGDILYFTNFYNQCVKYELVSSGDTIRWQISRDANTGFISPQLIKIDQLAIDLKQEPDVQPSLTMTMRAYLLSEQAGASELSIQTTVASRYYRQ